MASILIIDDDPTVRTFLRTALEAVNHQVVEAADGNAGLDALLDSEIDLVLCDIFMPEKEGLETIKEIRQKFNQLPIVAMTGGSADHGVDFLSAATFLGVRDTLRKPISPEKLHRVIEANLISAT